MIGNSIPSGLLILICIAAGFILVSSSCGDRPDLTYATYLADSLRSEYAPDARTTDFTVEFARTREGGLIVRGETTSGPLGTALMNQINRHYDEVLDSFRVLPAEELSNRPVGLVAVGVVPVREDPSFSAQQVTQATLGMPVRLLKKRDGWLRVQLPDDYLGWIEANSIVSLDRQEHDDWKNSRRALITSLHEPIYSSPHLDSSTVMQGSAGALIEIIAQKNSWIKIELPDDQKGWIKEDHLIDTEEWLRRAEESEPSDWVRTADGFTGLPYLWGGTSAYGVDCSGFTKMALYLNGLIIPRDASQQVEAGKALDVYPDSPIDWKDYETGDLFFFGSIRSDSSHKITHVAFHTGDGDMLHSSTQVRRESLNERDSLFNDYRRNTLLEARRFEEDSDSTGKIVPVRLHPLYFN